MTQLCLPEMEEKGWGRVIFCSSVAGFNGGVVGPHYA
jgi:3-oxoacyl-[acyl-carrier protein] reductase